MSLAFLKNISLKSNAAIKTPVARAASNAVKNPETADIRIFKNGAVYPSTELVQKCNLQYTMKTAEDKGNAFDVFSSKDFMNTSHLEDKCIFIALVPKAAGRADLFAATKYDENDVATADVLTQGAVTGGLALLELVKEVYGIEIPEGKSYMDLVIVTDSEFKTDNDIYFVPKKVSRGPKKGEVDIVRREKTSLYALVPASMLEEGKEESNAIQDEDTAGLGNAELSQSPGPDAQSNLSLADIEAENDGIVTPPAALPADILEDNTPVKDDSVVDPTGAAGFTLEEDADDDDSLLTN